MTRTKLYTCFLRSSLATINFGINILVRIKIGKDTVFCLADCVIEFMNQQRNITYRHAAVFTPARNEHHLSRTQNFIVEECAGNPCMPFHAEYQVNDIRIVVMHRCSGRIAFHIKMAIYWIFITKRRLAGL